MPVVISAFCSSQQLVSQCINKHTILSLLGNSVILCLEVQRQKNVPWLIRQSQQGLTTVKDVEGTSGAATELETLKGFASAK